MPQSVDIAPPVGSIRPSYCAASGKCLLAFSPEYVQRFVGCKLQKFTEYTITDWDELLRELEKVRQQGYAVEREEVELGMTCVAAPIFSGSKVMAAISVSSPVTHMTEEVQNEIITYVKKTAADITQALR